jgi:hypothetical protein
MLLPRHRKRLRIAVSLWAPPLGSLYGLYVRAAAVPRYYVSQLDSIVAAFQYKKSCPNLSAWRP